jgi:AcrR family transcriptional regulator
MSSVADKGTRDSHATSRQDSGATGAIDAPGRPAEPSPRRHYDARASRQALLDAASALFDERGYDAATVREIGERAGVDAALIARYFGGKEGLYLAALARQEGRGHVPADPAEALVHMLTRADERGSGPIGLAMVSPTLTDAMRDQVRAIVHRYVVEPLAVELAAAGSQPTTRRGSGGGSEDAAGSEPAAGRARDAELRAELLVAIATGVSLIRAGGTLPALAEASLEDVLDVLAPLVVALQA